MISYHAEQDRIDPGLREVWLFIDFRLLFQACHCISMNQAFIFEVSHNQTPLRIDTSITPTNNIKKHEASP